MLYEIVPEDQSQVLRNLNYSATEDTVDPRRVLDFYLPTKVGADPWPTMIFVHGGGWDSGNKDLQAAGVDVYGNIGRFYTERGYGVANINYRLQPKVEWYQQVADVQQAFLWVRDHVAEYGGDPNQLFLAGHSAGGHLVSHAAFGRAGLAQSGEAEALCGLISVSGTGFDLEDQRTFDLGDSRDFYRRRFRTGNSPNWQREASLIPQLQPSTVSVLLLHSDREWASLQHQNKILEKALNRHGVPNQRVEVKGESHRRMVLAMSASDRSVSQEILRFLQTSTNRCRPASAGEDLPAAESAGVSSHF